MALAQRFLERLVQLLRRDFALFEIHRHQFFIDLDNLIDDAGVVLGDVAEVAVTRRSLEAIDDLLALVGGKIHRPACGPEGFLNVEQQVGQVMANRRYSGLTPFGTKLRQKVIDGIVLPKLRQPRKPFLVIGITDGRPQGEDPSVLEDTVRYAVNSTQKLGPGAVAFQFAQVGNDQKGESAILS